MSNRQSSNFRYIYDQKSGPPFPENTKSLNFIMFCFCQGTCASVTSTRAQRTSAQRQPFPQSQRAWRTPFVVCCSSSRRGTKDNPHCPNRGCIRKALLTWLMHWERKFGLSCCLVGFSSAQPKAPAFKSVSVGGWRGQIAYIAHHSGGGV